MNTQNNIDINTQNNIVINTQNNNIEKNIQNNLDIGKNEKFLIIDKLLLNNSIENILNKKFIKEYFNFTDTVKVNRFIRSYCSYKNIEPPAISKQEVADYRIKTIQQHVELYGMEKVFNIEYIKNLFHFEHRSARRWLQRYCRIKNINDNKFIFDKNTEKYKIFALIKEHIDKYGEEQVLNIKYIQQLFNCKRNIARNRLSSYCKNNPISIQIKWRNNKDLLNERLNLMQEHIDKYGITQVLKPQYLIKIFNLQYKSKYVYKIIDYYCKQHNITNPIRIRYNQEKMNLLLLDLLKKYNEKEVLNINFIKNYFQYKNKCQVKPILEKFLNSNEYQQFKNNNLNNNENLNNDLQNNLNNDKKERKFVSVC